jgi:AAA15 family ATPase/GTPase
MAEINKFFIEHYRGINNLKIEQLNQVNLVVGDNNCGKTSLLEALQLLGTSGNLANVYRIARQRESIFGVNSNSIYENFICMFPHDGSELEIEISGECNGKKIAFMLEGIQKKILIDAKELDRFVLREMKDISGELETDIFDGVISFQYGDEKYQEEVDINRFSRLSGTPMLKAEELNIVYISPFEHLKGNTIGQIIRNDGYKEICLKALQLFDPDIVDMMIFRSDIGNRPVEYLKHRKLGNMPLSTFGDGIKKVLVLSNAIARATGGILLIDEIETAIHKKYYDDIFRFVVKACKTFDVQVFITTHSLEAIDGLLATQEYEEQKTEDSISVVTLKREDNNTYSRVLSGRDVAFNREAFGFEVRL